MKPAEIGLFILAGLIVLLGWYVDKHSEKEPHYKKPKRCPKCGARL